MDRNTKIALGCGGAGCLGLIVVVIAGVLLYSFLGRSFTSNSNRRTFNFNLNSNSNSNANRSANRNSSANTDSSDSENETSSMSDDERHKLFHAAGVAQDTALFARVLKKMGFMNASGTMTAAYEQFINDHFTWALRNTEFINSVNTPAKARAYIEEHLNQ